MNLKEESWVVYEPLDRMQREKLFILLEAAGFYIYPDYREHHPEVKGYSYPAWPGKDPNRYGISHIFGNENNIRAPWVNFDFERTLPLSILQKELAKIIKNE